MISRMQLSEFEYLFQNFPVIGIIGPRQVGKTTFVRSWSESLQTKVTYLDLEDQRDLVKLTDADTYFESRPDHVLVIDEIQIKPDLFQAIRVAVDRTRRKGHFVILGSASPVLIRNSADSLAGRVAYLEMHPINLAEKPQDVSVSQHWFRGGMPDALLANSDRLWRDWTANYLRSYVERDLPQLGLNASPQLLDRLLRMIASMQGGLLNTASFSRSIKLDQRTLKSYLNYLEEAFLIRSLPPFHSNSRKRLIKSPKIYLRDTGLFHYLANLTSFDELENHIIVGNSWESYIIQQVIAKLKPEITPYFFRTLDGAEIDLICCKGEEVIAAIEVKLTNAPKLNKSLALSVDALNPKLALLVTPNAENFPLNKKIQVCNPSSMLGYLDRVNLIA